MADRQTDDFKLGNKAADMWLYTADACANEKVIPKKYRYTTGTALMNGAEAICSCIEGANLIDLRERPAERLAMQREALCACKKLERKILRMAESKQYPGVSGQKAATWSKAVMTVRYMCAAWYEKEPRCPGERGCSAAIAAFHWGIACSRRQLGPALPELECQQRVQHQHRRHREQQQRVQRQLRAASRSDGITVYK